MGSNEKLYAFYAGLLVVLILVGYMMVLLTIMLIHIIRPTRIAPRTEEIQLDSIA
jgi:hypothetical protein